MKKKNYIVIFKNERSVFVSCFDAEEAEILAKAIMIRNGLSKDVKSIIETMNARDWEKYRLYSINKRSKYLTNLS